MKVLFLIGGIVLFGAKLASAQTFTPNVSKDSVGVLTARQESLKASMKVQELKIKEAEYEAEVEKLRLKLLEANGNAKESAAQNSGEQANTGDAKAIEKLAKKAKNDAADAKKALTRYEKQIEKVDELRNEIRTEERKLTYKKPNIIFNYN